MYKMEFGCRCVEKGFRVWGLGCRVQGLGWISVNISHCLYAVLVIHTRKHDPTGEAPH